jgi:fibronectin-binding autotransporter adhesin
MKPKGLARNLLGTSALTMAIVVSFVAPTASAASATWTNGGGDNQWQTTTNWDATPIPGAASSDVATFSTTGATGTIDLGGSLSILNLTFGVSGGDAASFAIGDADDTLNFTTAGGITINSGVTTAQTIGASGTTINLSTAAAASTTFTNNGTGLLTVAGNIVAQNASGAGVLTVAGTGNTSITGTITEPGVGNNALLKTGSGTLTLSNGSTWSGTGAIGRIPATAAGFSMVVREGTLRLNGGTHSVIGEAVIGGIVADGGAGQNAKIQVDAGSLAISSWLSIGRGNGVGGVSSDLVLNNAATVTATEMSAGFNGGNAANLPKGTITLNGTSSLSVNNNVLIAESAGSNVTLDINDSASFAQTANVAQTRVGMANGAVGVINVNGGSASFQRDLVLGYAGTGSGKLVLNSGSVNVATATERWLIIGQQNTSSGELTVNGGNLNLNTNTDLRFSTTTAAAGTNVVNLNGGSISGFTGNNNGILSANSVVDLNFGSTSGTLNNTFNLNGGTLAIGQVLTTQNSGTVAFNFNGGTLKAAAATTAFFDLGGASQRANVRNGGAVIDTNGVNVTVGQALLHSNIGGDNAIDGGLTKNGNGILTLSGTNTYTGATTVSVGTLALASTGSLTSTQISVSSGATYDVSAVSGYSVGSGVTLTNNGTVNGGFTVAAGGTVNGSGTFSNAVTVNGNLNPGNSPGTVTFANGLALAAGSNLGWELNANTDSGAGTNFDQVLVTGGALTVADGAMLNLSFTGTVDFTDGFWASDHTWTIVDFAGTGDEGALTLGSISGGVGDFNEFGSFSTSNENGDQVLTWTAVPEPGAALLGGLGMLGLLRRRRQG